MKVADHQQLNTELWGESTCTRLSDSPFGVYSK